MAEEGKMAKCEKGLSNRDFFPVLFPPFECLLNVVETTEEISTSLKDQKKQEGGSSPNTVGV